MSDIHALFEPEGGEHWRASAADSASSGVRALGALADAMVREDNRQSRDALGMVATELVWRIQDTLERLRVGQQAP